MVQASFKFLIFLPPPSDSWDHRPVLSHIDKKQVYDAGDGPAALPLPTSVLWVVWEIVLHEKLSDFEESKSH